MRRITLALILLNVLAGTAGCLGNEKTDPPQEIPQEPRELVGPSPIIQQRILQHTMFVTSSSDDAQLRTDVYKPPGDGPFPTILVQSPYWSFLGDQKTAAAPIWYISYFVPRGYAVVLGEMRGTRDSGGCWDFGGKLDQQDGHDIVEAIAEQIWSNGKVGMLGQSHVGMSQIAAAVTAPPHLTTIVPIAAVTDWYRYLHKDGAPYVLNRATPPAYFAVHASPSTSPILENPTPHWVLTQAMTACPDNAIHLSQSAELDGDKDAYWQERDLIARASNINASVFLVHGFLDENVKTDHFLDFWNNITHVPRKAWFGQWYHEHPAYFEWRDDLHRWFDYWLLGRDNGIMDEPPVTVQDNLMVARSQDTWPPNSTQLQSWTPEDDGRLRPTGPDTVNDRNAGFSPYASHPQDDRGAVPLPAAQAFQAFISEPLDADLHITGEPRILTEATITALTARLIAVLYDIDPQGNRDEITRAYMDARHRNGPETNELVPLLDPVQYNLSFYPRDHVIQAGHRLELVFLGGDMGCNQPRTPASSPYAGTCEGTGILPVEIPVDILLHVGGQHETRLWLPVVTKAGPERTIEPLESWLENQPE